MRSKVLLGVLSVLALVWVGRQLLGSAAGPPEPPPPSGPVGSPTFSIKVPEGDVLQATLPSAQFVPKASVWAEQDKTLFADLLTRSGAEILVVPCQIRGYGFDRIERSLMSARLTRRIAVASNRKTVDPFLAARALGERQRTYVSSAVMKLAEALRATKVIWCHVGHDGKGAMTWTLQAQERNGETGQWSDAVVAREWKDLPFDDVRLPSEVMKDGLDEAMAALGFSAGALPAPATDESSVPVPESPHAVISPEAVRSPIARAYHQQLLATLHPAWTEIARERAFVRSLLVLDEAAGDSRVTRLLRARAMLHLARRPAALDILGQPQSPQEQALLALANGHLPDCERHTAKISEPMAALLAGIEINDLRSKYRKTREKELKGELQQMSARYPGWAALIERRFAEWDAWAPRGNEAVKKLLDKEFPVANFSLKDIVRGQMVVHREGEVAREVRLSALRHLQRLAGAESAVWCCDAAIPGRWDYLNLLVDLAEANMLWEVDFLGIQQGRPMVALELLREHERIYRGHPAFAVTRVEMLGAIIPSMAESERPQLHAEATEAALDTLYWSQGQDRFASYSAAFYGSSIGLDDDQARLRGAAFVNAYGSDLPCRSYWSTVGRAFPEYGVSCSPDRQLEYSSWDFSVLHAQLDRVPSLEHRQKLLAEKYANRFVGSPDRAQYTESLARQASSSQTGGVTALYEERIRQDPNSWGGYHELGKALVEAGDYAKAAETFMSYPGFQNANDENRVGLSNAAYAAGSVLYWVGAIDEAIPLYRLSAGYDTGSAGSLTSAARLASLEGDFVDAARIQLERAKRYSNAYAYRDYLALLHALGHGKEAALGFDAVMDQFKEHHVWASALVGQRRDGMTQDQIAAWLRQERQRRAGNGRASEHHGTFAQRHAILANAVDRVPGPGFAKLIADLDNSPASFVSEDGLWTQQNTSIGLENVGPSPAAGSPPARRVAGAKLEPKLVYFARAYALLRAGKFVEARKAFEELASHYVIETYEKPYFARAVAKGGNAADLEKHVKYLDQYKVPTFDDRLARAFAASASGAHDAALEHLRRALNMRPHTEARPIFTEYQFAEACEWLFEDTQNDAYRVLALDWARVHQRLQPMFAWAYAMEARLTRNEQDRVRAIALTLYLDPLSDRVGDVSPAQRKAAQAWLAKNNPFARPSSRPVAGT